ncbi:MAG: acylphosphatase [Pseudomonadota bacterium]
MTLESDHRQVRAVVSGCVQGVWYRAWTGEEASDLGLNGWVRNRRDGTVEAVFAGTPDSVEQMIALCHDGPPLAKVTNVDVRDDDSAIESGFLQLPTA